MLFYIFFENFINGIFINDGFVILEYLKLGKFCYLFKYDLINVRSKLERYENLI